MATDWIGPKFPPSDPWPPTTGAVARRRARPVDPSRTLGRMTLDARLAGAPITWGVCEVPGWGVMLPAERVLMEMRSLGLSATELGAPGFLPRDPDELRAVLDRHELGFIGGF